MADIQEQVTRAGLESVAKAAAADPSRFFLAAVAALGFVTFGFLQWVQSETLVATTREVVAIVAACGIQ